MAHRRAACLTAVLLAAVGPVAVACSSGTDPANDFCTSYGDAMRGVVAAAHAGDPVAFGKIYRSTMDNMSTVRAKAPDDKLRSAFDRSMFTFSVFSNDSDLAGFLVRINFSDDAVVVACGEYGVDVRV